MTGRPIPSGAVIDTCANEGTARLVLACIERRVRDMRFIGWPALAQSWSRDVLTARQAMKRRGWTT